jgi:hypothetical protein
MRRRGGQARGGQVRGTAAVACGRTDVASTSRAGASSETSKASAAGRRRSGRRGQAGQDEKVAIAVAAKSITARAAKCFVIVKGVYSLRRLVCATARFIRASAARADVGCVLLSTARLGGSAAGQYEHATGVAIVPDVPRGPASARTTSRMSRRGAVGWHKRLTRPREARRGSGEAERERGGLGGRSA